MNIVNKIYLPQTIKKYQHKIASLGPNNNIGVASFLLTRSFISLLLFLSLLLLPNYGLIWAIIIVSIFYLSYTYFLIDINIKKRQNDLYDEAVNFFQLVKLSFMDTKDLRKALAIVSQTSNSSFAKDFLISLHKNEYNNNIRLVFKDMEEKIPNDDIKMALIDLAANSNYILALDDIIKRLQLRSRDILNKKYQMLPYTLSLASLLFIILFILIIIYLPSILKMF
jgi:Flp pilus assembly protein TadB